MRQNLLSRTPHLKRRFLETLPEPSWKLLGSEFSLLGRAAERSTTLPDALKTLDDALETLDDALETLYDALETLYDALETLYDALKHSIML